jgi:hypothetical protein
MLFPALSDCHLFDINRLFAKIAIRDKQLAERSS